MYGIRRKISAGAVASMAVLGLLGVTTAPAAAGPGSVSRPFLTESTRAASLRERSSWYLGSRFRVRVDRRSSTARWRRSQARADRARRSSARRAWRPRTAWCASSSRPGLRLASASVAGLGGRVERTFGNLVQAARPEQADRALAAIDRRSRPYSVHALRPRPGRGRSRRRSRRLAREGFTGKGVKVAIIDGGFEGLADRQAEGELPANVVTQDFCGGELATASEHGTAVAEIVHEMAPDAALSPLRRHRGRSRRGGDVREEPGRPRDQPLRGVGGLSATTEAVRSERSSRTLGRAESSGSTLPGTRGRPTGRRLQPGRRPPRLGPER